MARTPPKYLRALFSFFPFKVIYLKKMATSVPTDGQILFFWVALAILSKYNLPTCTYVPTWLVELLVFTSLALPLVCPVELASIHI